jgi:hypothetical protein
MEKNLIIDPLLISKLERINSPIAKHLLDLRESEQDIENLSINYLGISSENPSFISYLNEDRYEKIKNTNKRAITNFTCTFKDSAFCPQDIDFFDPPADFVDNTLHSCEDSDFPTHKQEFNSELVGNFTLPILVYYTDGPEIDLKELLKVKFDEHGLYRFSLWPNDFNYNFITVRCTIRASKFLDYIDIQDINTIEVENTDFYNPKLRYHSSIGKLLKKVIPEVDSLYDQKEMANFITLFKSESFKELGTNHEFIFEEATGDRVLWGYHHTNYYEHSNTLGSSCMRYGYCQEYLHIYSENPDKISLGMLLKENKVAARALIWRIGDDVWFDRIYAMDHDTEIILKNHLEELEMNNCYGGDYKLFVNLENTYFSYYPYMDTFKYLVQGKGLSTDCSVSYDKELTDADGNVESRCECCEDTDCETHEITIGSNRGDYVCTDCGVFLADDEYAMRDNATYCEHSDTYELTRNVTRLFNGTYAHEDDTVIAEDGEYYLTDNVENYCIEFEREWYPFEHFEVKKCDGQYYHENSLEYQDYLLEQEEVELQENKTNEEQIKENEQSKEINTIPADTEDDAPFYIF